MREFISIVEDAAIINELFDSKLPWRWDEEIPASRAALRFEHLATFNVPGFPYPYVVGFDGVDDTYSIFFAYLKDDGKIETYPSDVGNANYVYSTILDIIDNFINTEYPHVIKMSGQVPKQTNLYRKIAERIIKRYPDWHIEYDPYAVLLHRDLDYTIAESANEQTTFDVYHGTDANFKAFDSRMLGSANGTAPINMLGFNFTDNPDLAKSFGKNVIKATVTLTNPYVIDAKGQNYSEFKHDLNDLLDNVTKKHDGVIIKNYADAGKYADEYIHGNHYIVFNPKSINLH